MDQSPLTNGNGSPPPSIEQLHLQPASDASPLSPVAAEPNDANDENDDNTMEDMAIRGANLGEKRKREGRLRSVAWQHFTKLVKEDGSYDKCKCNHCNKLFTSSSRIGTTHLLRHITEGSCPAFKKEKKEKPQTTSRRKSSDQKSSVMPWQFYQGLGEASEQDMQDDLLPVPVGFDDLENQTCSTYGDVFGGQTPTHSGRKLPQQSATKSQPRGESWINELQACVGKLVDLTSDRAPKDGSAKAGSSSVAIDYSISAALKCLNEMEDIPESSAMYLDAIEIIRDSEERECFICLNPEPRRRWLQRMLHRHYPSKYTCDV